MPKSRPPYSPEFRRQMVDLVLTGRDRDDLARECEPTGQPPAHHTVDRRDRTAVDLGSQRLAMRISQQRRRARHLSVAQLFRPFGVELHHSVAHDLQGDIADQRRLRARVARRTDKPHQARRPAAQRPAPVARRIWQTSNAAPSVARCRMRSGTTTSRRSTKG